MVLDLADFKVKYGRRGAGAIIRSLLTVSHPLPGEGSAYTEVMVELADLVADLEQLMSDDTPHVSDPNPCLDTSCLNHK
jgi:hypothetical protein